MQEMNLTLQKVFSLKRKTIEKRLSAYYEKTHDEKATVQILIALQVRDELGEADFSFFLKDLVRKLFLKTKSTRTLRRYYLFLGNILRQRNGACYHCAYFQLKLTLPKSLSNYIRNLSKHRCRDWWVREEEWLIIKKNYFNPANYDR